MQLQECQINSILDGRNPLIIPVGFNCQLIRYKLPLIAKDHFNELLPYSHTAYIPSCPLQKVSINNQSIGLKV